MFVTLLEWQLPKPNKPDSDGSNINGAMEHAKPSMAKTEVALAASPSAKPAPPAIVRVASISLDDDSDDDADDADDKDSSKEAAALPTAQRLPPVALTILPLILECVLGTKRW